MARALANQRPTDSSTDSRYLEQGDDIVRALKVLRDQRAEVSISFESESGLYRVKVLDVTDTELLLEDIQPRTGHSLLAKGLEFTATCRVQGLYTYFSGNRVASCEAERGLPYYRVSLPTRMLYQQRRRAARFRIPLKVAGNGAKLTLLRAHPETGEIIDISAGGCRVAFDSQLSEPLIIDRVRENCEIDVPNLLNLEGVGIVRHCHVDSAKAKTVCGIELVDMSVTARRRLEQFIQSISRASQRS